MSKSKGTDIVTIALLGALGVGGFLIFKNRKEIGNFFGGIGEGVQDFTDGIGNWYGETVTNIQKGVDDVGKNVGGFFDGVVKGATGVVKDISGSYVNFIGGIQDTVTGIQKGAGEFAENVGNFFGGIAQGITDFFGGKRVTEESISKAPEVSKTPIKKPLDLSAYDTDKNGVKLTSVEKFANWSMGIDPSQVEVIGRKLTEKEKAEMATNPPKITKSLEDYAQEDNFIGRVSRFILSRKK